MNAGAIVAQGISKRFGGVQALEAVTIDVRPGEVHALLGANGAGKSTLIGILSGAIAPDSGAVAVAGRRLPPGGVVAAKRAGVMVVHQELMLFPDLTVEQNVAAFQLPLNRALLLDRRQLRARAASVLTSLGLPGPLARKVGELSLAQQQIVEIGRAVFGGGRVLILDEPTSALSQPETATLLNVIRTLARQGVAVIFVSHRLDEAMKIAQRITVLRDGKVQGTWAASAIDLAGVTRAMVGEIVVAHSPAAASTGGVVLSLRDLRGPDVGPVSFDLHEGEIVGLIGLEGSGTDALLRMLGGATPYEGALLMHGKRLRLRHPAEALRAGLVYMPPDRKREGLWLDASPIWNITTAVIRRTAALRWPGSPTVRATGRTRLTEVGVRLSGADAPVARLSGGNQQRVLFARALEQRPRVLLLSDPLRGVDVKAKATIHELIAGLARGGLAICVAGSDIDEILMLAHRIICMRAGRIVATGDRAEFNSIRVVECVSAERAA